MYTNRDIFPSNPQACWSVSWNTLFRRITQGMGTDRRTDTRLDIQITLETGRYKGEININRDRFQWIRCMRKMHPE